MQKFELRWVRGYPDLHMGGDSLPTPAWKVQFMEPGLRRAIRKALRAIGPDFVRQTLPKKESR